MWIGANNDQIRLPRGLNEWFWAMFEPTPIWPDFTFGQLCIWVWANNYPIWLLGGQMSDFEQCLNPLQLYITNLDFGQLFMWIGANNDQIRLPRGLNEWFWAMFEPTPIWPDFTFGQLCIWVWANNYPIWLLGGQMSDFEQCLNSPLVNFLWPESQFRQNKWRSYQADRPLV